MTDDLLMRNKSARNELRSLSFLLNVMLSSCCFISRNEGETACSLALAALAYGLTITPTETLTLLYRESHATEMAAFYSWDRPNLIPSRGQSCTRLIKLQDLLDGSNLPEFSSANSLVLSWHEHQITFKPAGFEPCLISACVRSSNLK